MNIDENNAILNISRSWTKYASSTKVESRTKELLACVRDRGGFLPVRTGRPSR